MSQHQVLRTGFNSQIRRQCCRQMRLLLVPDIDREKCIRQQKVTPLVEGSQRRQRIRIAGETEDSSIRLHTITYGRYGMPRFTDAHST